MSVVILPNAACELALGGAELKRPGANRISSRVWALQQLGTGLNMVFISPVKPSRFTQTTQHTWVGLSAVNVNR